MESRARPPWRYRGHHLRQPWSQCAPDEHSDAGRDLPSLAKDPLFE